MTICAAKFTPEVLLSAPRRTPGLPNITGEKALYCTSTYSFENHAKSSQMCLLDISSGKSSILFENPAFGEPAWLSKTEFIFFSRPAGGSTVLMEADLNDRPLEPREVACLPGSFSAIKVKHLAEGVVALACVAVAKPDGTPYNPVTEAKKHTSAKAYSSLFVRHWDAYVTENTNSVWYGCLEKRREAKSCHVPEASLGSSSGQGSAMEEHLLPMEQKSPWQLVGERLTNLLAGRGLECPVPPFGGPGDFDLSPKGIAFVARDPDISPALYTKTNLYFVPLSSFTETSPPAPLPVTTPGLEGYSSSPTFSPCGNSLVFGRMRSIQYESDKPRMLLVSDVDDVSQGVPAEEFYRTEDGEGAWDMRPDWFLWSRDGSIIFTAAEKNGRNVLWRHPSSPSAAGSELPVPILADGSVNDARLLPGNEKLFVTSSSLVDSSTYSILTLCQEPKAEVISSNSKGGRVFGLSRCQSDEFWFQSGVEGSEYNVHALVMKPSDFDPSKKYPLAFLIHGGPQGAWLDGWSTRWNPAVFAEQGYVTVMPNPSGSTGYGMGFQNAIRESWGGRPYQDLVNCFEYIDKELQYVDTERAVALGASYGGYMINWIQGQSLGRRFKALVCHDGVFSTLNQFSSEELYFPIHDFGGTLWENRDGYARWDPARFTAGWDTPQLIIHNELDYRLPISEGLAAFNVLQSLKIPSRFLTFPDENHWVLKPENSLVWHQEVLGWINKYSGLGDVEKKSVIARGGRIAVVV